MRDCVRPHEEEMLSTPTSWAVNPEYDLSLWFDNLVDASQPVTRGKGRGVATLDVYDMSGKSEASCTGQGVAWGARNCGQHSRRLREGCFKRQQQGWVLRRLEAVHCCAGR